jgi:hypothetical protein
MDRNLRFAHNPRLVEEGVFHDLTDAIETCASEDGKTTVAAAVNPGGSAQIIPFAATQMNRDKHSLTATKNRA